MPTVIIGNNTGDDYSGTEDATLQGHSAYANNNYGSATDIETSFYYDGYPTNALIKFSGLSNISSLVTVETSTLYIFFNSDNITGSYSTIFRRCLRDWIEGTQNGDNRNNNSPYSCCWNEYGGGNAWTTPGGMSDGSDRSATQTGSITYGTLNTYHSLSSSQLVADVENIINGAVNNYGWHMDFNHTSNPWNWKKSASSEGTDGQRPYLSVTYESSGGSSIVPIILAMNHFNGGM